MISQIDLLKLIGDYLCDNGVRLNNRQRNAVVRATLLIVEEINKPSQPEETRNGQ